MVRSYPGTRYRKVLHKGLSKGMYRFVYGYYLYDKNKDKHYISDVDDGCLTMNEIYPETLCECTDIKDKNDKNVFVNDIVLINGKEYMLAYGYIGGYEMLFIKMSEGDDIFYPYCSRPNIIEVIGNIYDHYNP